MSRLFKVVSLMLLVFLAAGALFAQDQPKKPVWPAYVFSLALGFGSGQYYLHENGTPFLIGDAIGYGGRAGIDVRPSFQKYGSYLAIPVAVGGPSWNAGSDAPVFKTHSGGKA